MSKFVHLHTHTHYSLLDGMTKIPDLVAKAKELGMTSLAITDHGNLYGAVEFYKECTKAGIKPILGVEAYIASGDHKEKSTGTGESNYYHLILLVKNETGWKNLLQLVTQSWLEGFYYRPRMDKEMLRKHHEGLIALSGCLSGELAKALQNNRPHDAEKIALEHQEIFGKENYFIELQNHANIAPVREVLPKQIALAKKLGIPMVATGDSHYLNSDDREVHDILLAIQTGKSVNDPKKFVLEDDFSFKPGEVMEKLFTDVPEAIENTAQIAQMCDFKLELGKILLPRFDTPDGSPSAQFMRKLVIERTPERYPVMNETIQKRIDYELGVIEKMGFPDYFLIVQDFINWAKDRGVVVGPGRGSAAGSIISYILKITDLDPIHYDLLFERFLNPERIQMPDIDVDITDVRRDEVFGYLTEKYGADRVAHIITFGTMAARAAIRDVGRATDIELAFCDRLAKLIPPNKDLGEALDEVAELAELYKKDERAKKLINAARKLEGVARHASVHACGTVIAAEPLPRRVPLQHAPQDENVVLTQFEMHAIEDLGLLKMDILGLKNLTIIEDTIRLVADTRDERIILDKLPLDDKQAFALFQRADTVGVFQLECLTGDTLVSDTTIERLYKKRTRNSLRSVYVDSGKVRNNRIIDVVQSGIKKVFRLTLENGRTIKASANHQFLTENGWKKLSELNIESDRLLYNPTKKYVFLHECVSCRAKREVLSENLRKHQGYCYTCSAKHFSNPSKSYSRQAISAGRRAFLDAGGTSWNYQLTKETSPILAATGQKISQALEGRTNVMKFGFERAALMHQTASKRFSGSNNPMFGKKAPHHKAGFREDLGHYVRSNWEADFARVLIFCGANYEYEPQTFALTRANGERLSYTPDFFVPATNTFYEIKGWLHDLDAEKMDLFQKQYPNFNFVLIEKTKFAEFALRYKQLVKWECPVFPPKFELGRIKSVEPLGEEMTYDILMEAPGNNFIANSFVVHNSGGMRRYLKELKPTNLEDIIAMVALYRPGPMELIPSYINRKYGKEIVTYLHPKMEAIMGKTFGIGIYQEQMMRIASDMAGYSLAEADTLRKAIGKKIKKLLDEQEVKLIAGLIKNGIAERTARQIWELFPPFARYGFNRCLTGDARIQNPKTGELITIKEIYQDRSRLNQTFSFNEQTKEIYENRIVDVISNGRKPVFAVETRSGKKIKATANHPFFTEKGWRLLENLNLGERIAVFALSKISWDEIAAINPCGIEETYDLTMEKDHNFIANDIFVHNSHAACYAMIAYRTAYLKAHYPTEFMTGLLNSESSDVERIGALIGECKKMNVQVLPPDINKSQQKFAPEGGNIRFGLDAIKNVGSNIVAAIIETRSNGGEFTSFSDLLSRVQHKDLNKKSLESLTKCGALDSFNIERNAIIQSLDEITKFAQAARKTAGATQGGGLFGSSFVSTAAPKALQLKDATPATKKEKLGWEKELLGLYVSDHPLAVANENGAVAALKPTRIKDVLTEKSTVKNYRVCGMVASVKSIITKTGKPMCFAKVEDQSGAIEVVVFSETFAKNQACWKEGAVIVCVGRLNFRNGEVSLVCDQVKEIS